MEFEERYNNAVESDLNQRSNCSENRVNTQEGFSVDKVDNVKYKQRHFTADTKSKSDDNIKKEEHEKFSIGESHTIWNPWAMMVHV